MPVFPASLLKVYLSSSTLTHSPTSEQNIKKKAQRTQLLLTATPHALRTRIRNCPGHTAKTGTETARHWIQDRRPRRATNPRVRAAAPTTVTKGDNSSYAASRTSRDPANPPCSKQHIEKHKVRNGSLAKRAQLLMTGYLPYCIASSPNSRCASASNFASLTHYTTHSYSLAYTFDPEKTAQKDMKVL